MAVNKDMFHAQTTPSNQLFNTACKVLDGVSELKERNAELDKARNFRTGKSLSLVDLRNAIDPKKMFLDTVLELFRNNKKYVEDYIDRNGKMATIGGVPVPAVGGSWGEPRRKNHVMFVRR